MDKASAEAPALASDPALHEGPAQNAAVRQLESAEVDVDQVCPVDILLHAAPVDPRLDGALCSKLAVIGGLRSFASFGGFGRGVGSIGALCEWSFF